MKARKYIAVVGAAALAMSLFAGSSAASAAAAKPTVVGTDVDGDWGQNVDPTIAPIGDAMGQDLTSASISYDGKNVNFIIGVNSLPPSGGTPEFSRYTWNFSVGKKHLELDGKFTNYSRGTCDPTAGTCPPPRDPGQQPFLVRGNCRVEPLVATNLTVCEELSKVQGVFDAAAGTITIPVPAADIGVKKGSKITPGTNIFGGTVSAAPAAFLSSTAFPLDTLAIAKTFVVK